jgi:trans-2,3-dihydro-3-hydroxyanthranilate isomerase
MTQKTWSFVTVDVFTESRFGGNPLAVFPDARGLSDVDMQSLAAEFNLSETTFVLPPSDPRHTARVRIFNRTAEMPFAGHPNVGTGYVLAQMDAARRDVLVFEEIAGLVEVRIARATNGEVTGATIAAPQPLSLGAELPADVVAACAGIDTRDVVTATHAPVLASVGNPFFIAQVRPDALARAVPDIASFRRASAARPELAGRLSLHLWAHDDTPGGDAGRTRLRARMFAPLAGTVEDPATGSANTPLAALLLKLAGAERRSYDIVQGVEMGRPSQLFVTAWRAADGIRADVRGSCVEVLRGEARV